MQILTRLCCAAIVGSLTFTGLASAKEKKPYKVGDETWMCDDDGQCDPAPDKIIDRKVMEGSVLERELRLDAYVPHCGNQPNDCYHHVLQRDLKWWEEGIKQAQFEEVFKRNPDAVRYQIIDGELYRVVGLDGEAAKCKHKERCEGIEFAILKFLDLYVLPGDIEFAVNLDDLPMSPKRDPVPVFSVTRNLTHNDILMPHWSFWKGGPCLGDKVGCIERWDKMRGVLLKEAEKWPWAKKVNTNFFRGEQTPNRNRLRELAKEHLGLLDVKFTSSKTDPGYPNNADMVPLPDMCRYRGLFNMAGARGMSTRMRHLFLCQSLVYHVDLDNYEEFWYTALKKYVHYVPVSADMTDVVDHLTWAKENPDLAHRTANNGYEFVKRNLRMIDIYNYWYDLLRNYYKVQKWKVEKHPRAKHLTLAKGGAKKDEL